MLYIVQEPQVTPLSSHTELSFLRHKMQLNEKNQFLSPIVSPVNRDFLFFSALPRKILPGFSGKIFWIFLSSFHVCRQCSPVQIKYVSFADRKHLQNR